MALNIRPAGEGFAAEIDGVVFVHPPTDEQVLFIEAAMARHAVVVLRNQDISDDQQIAFSRCFGPLELPPRLNIIRRDAEAPLRLRPELYDVSNLDQAGNIEPADTMKRQFAKANELFHSDSSFNALPTKWSLLSARVLPAAPTYTEFVDMRAVYAALEQETRDTIQGLEAEHSLWRSRERAGFAPSDAQRNALPPVRHPLVRIAADGRPTLYIGAHASCIVGWPLDEGRALLDSLYAFASQPRFIYRHRWQEHDLLIWDNRCTMHRAVPYDDMREKRDVRRTTINESGEERAATRPVA